tara:strand:- start:9233 stop:11572 length:2340 start_codon:yes stop_codon:yes gene_type:complete
MKNDNRQKKTSLAKLLATEDISVHVKKVPTASFDIKNRELSLPDWKDMSSDTLDMLIGHEVGHALYSPIELLEEGKERKIPKSFINVIEDVRIEKMIQSRYPGLVRLFKNAYVDLVEKDIFGIKDKDLSELGLIDRINIFYKTGIDIPFLDSESWVHDRLSKCLTYQDVLELSKDIADFMEDNKESQGQSVKQDDDLIESEDSDEEVDSESDSEDSESDSEDSESESDEKYDSQSGSEDSDEEVDSKLSKKNDDWDTDYSSESITDKNLEKNLSEKSDLLGVNDYVSFPDYDLKDIIWTSEECQKIQDDFDKTLARTDEEKTIYENGLRKYFMDFKKESSSTINYLVKEFEMKKSASLYSRAATSKSGSLDVNSLHRYKFDDDLFKKVTVLPNGKNHGFIMYVDWSGSMYTNILPTMKQILNLVWFANRINVPFEVYAFSSESKHNSSTGYYDTDTEVLNRGESPFKYKQNDVYIGNLGLFEIASSKMNSKKLDDSLCFWFGIALKMLRSWNEIFSGYMNFRMVASKLDMQSTPLIGTLVVHDRISKNFMTKHNVEKLNTIVLTDGLSNAVTKYMDSKNDDGSWKTKNCSCFTYKTYDPKTGSYIDNPNVTTFKMGNKEFKITNSMVDEYDYSGEMLISEIVKFHKSNISQSFIGLHLLQTSKKGILTGKNFSEFSHYNKSIKKEYNIDFDGWHFWDTVEGKKLVKKTNKEKFLSCGNVFNFDDYYILPGGVGLDLDNDMLSDDLVGASRKDLVKAFSKNRDSRSNSRVFLKRFISEVV